MMLKIGHIYQATETLWGIIDNKRALPGKGAYGISRLYAKLKPEYDLIAKRRDAMIEAYDHHEMVNPPMTKEDPLGQGEKVPSPNFSVPPDKVAEYRAAWAEVAAEEIEVDVQPLSLSHLGDVITAGEFVALDDLVKED